MYGKKTILLILIIALSLASFLTAVLGYFFLPEYKMNDFTPRENEIVRWSYLLVGISSSLMAVLALAIWLVSIFKFRFFTSTTIVEIIVAVTIVVFWILLVTDEAWGAFWRLHTITVF
jgi:hypothetical protein